MIRRTMACLLLVGVLSSCGVVKVKKPPDPGPTVMPEAIRFEGGNAGETPPGWRVQGPMPDDPAKHKLELTKSERRAGKMSLQLSPLGKTKGYERTHAQLCAHSPFPGSAVRVTAFVKGERGALVLFGVGYSGQNSNPVNNLNIVAPRWRKVDVVNPGGPRPSALGVLELCIWFDAESGRRAWIDEITFSKVDFASLPPEKIQPVPLENMDMERFDRQGKLDSWALSGSPIGKPTPGYELRADRKTKRSGAASLVLTGTEPDQQAGTAHNCFDPQQFKGKRMRVVGWLKADVVEQSRASMGMSASPLSLEEAMALSPEELRNRRDDWVSSYVNVLQPVEWTRVEHVLTVPQDTANLCVSVSVGLGSVWLDDLSVDVVAI